MAIRCQLQLSIIVVYTMTTCSMDSMDNKLTICHDNKLFEYDMDECPGGIQIRDANQWFSNSRETVCIGGNGAILQFNGNTEEWAQDIYPFGFPARLKPVLGSWVNYKIKPTFEQLQGTEPSALFINAQKYENPDSYPTRCIDIRVEEVFPEKLSGGYQISFKSGLNNRQEAKLSDLLRTILINTKEPVLITEDPNADEKESSCAYNSTSPSVVLAKYITASWDGTDLAQSCAKQVYKPYSIPTRPCPRNCTFAKQFVEPPPKPSPHPSVAYGKLVMSMAEIATRLKYTEQLVVFNQQEHPYIALLQRSCHVFQRAFPTLMQLDTLMNAVVIFGTTLEGLVPHRMEKGTYDQISLMLGRCSAQGRKHRASNKKLVADVCSTVKRTVNGTYTDSFKEATLAGAYNVVVDLLWKVVQYSHASCLGSFEHFPNVHHFYTNAMVELFSAPAVQLLWYQQGKEDCAPLGKVMKHIFPELPDYVLPMIDDIFSKLKFQTHFSILKRPQVKDLEKRDIRCMGHGKLIWNGRACCYGRSDDRKYYHFNRVSLATL